MTRAQRGGSSMAGWLISIATLFGIALAASPAWAGDPALAKPKDATARAHLDKGNALYGVRQFEDAAKEYIAGAVIEAAPVFDYNLGQSYRQLGKYQDAIWHYDRFLNYGNPGDELRGFVGGFIAQMKAELVKHAMTQPPTEPGGETSHDSGGSSRWSDGVALGLAGSGLAVLAVSGYLYMNASGLRNDALTEPDEGRRTELRDSADKRSLAGTVMAIGGAGLLIAGTVKLVVHEHGSSEEAEDRTWDLAHRHRHDRTVLRQCRLHRYVAWLNRKGSPGISACTQSKVTDCIAVRHVILGR